MCKVSKAIFQFWKNNNKLMNFSLDLRERKCLPAREQYYHWVETRDQKLPWTTLLIRLLHISLNINLEFKNIISPVLSHVMSLSFIRCGGCHWVWPCQSTIRKRWWCDWCLGFKWTCQMFLHKRRCHKEMMDDRDFTSSSLEHHRSLLVISIAIQYRGMNGINIMLMLSSICILINIIWDLTTIFFLLL